MSTWVEKETYVIRRELDQRITIGDGIVISVRAADFVGKAVLLAVTVPPGTPVQRFETEARRRKRALLQASTDKPEG